MDKESGLSWRRGSAGQRAWIILAIWSIYGLFNTLLVHYRSMLYGRPMGWAECAIYEMFYVWIWATVTPLVLTLSRRCPLGSGHLWRNGFVHSAAALTAAIVVKIVWDFTAVTIVAPAQVPTNMEDFLKSILRALDLGLLHYLLIIVAHHAVEYYRRYEDGRVRAWQLEARLANAQLQALKMQLHPHFLFNTLQSIAELVHDDPRRAETMIVRLSDFLRLTLDQIGVAEIRLAEEIDFLRRYLEIEQMRFEERLQVEWDIDASALSLRVPNLILQPIVENAFRHGLSKKKSGGLLRISCRREDRRLVLRVTDNGPGPVRTTADLQNPVREGVGLNNTRSRLERLYGGDHLIEFRRTEEAGFAVTIRIPIREREVDPARAVNDRVPETASAMD